MSVVSGVLAGPKAARKKTGPTPASLFVVDIGNSVLKTALLSPVESPFRFCVEWDLFPANIRDYLSEVRRRAGQNLACGICSVVPSRNHAIATLIHHYLGVDPVFLTTDSEYSFVNGYETPWTVGVDRLCAVEGALEEHEPPLAVFAFGTALAVTLVSSDRVLLGGWIAPGYQTSFRALQEYAELLRDTPMEQPDTQIGRNTPTAVSNGIYLLLRGGIVRMMESARQVLGHDCTFLATGGDCSLFQDLFHECDEDLVFKGIARILARTR